MAHLGGSSLFLGQDVGFGRRESVADFGRMLGEYVDVVVVRANHHKTAVELAEHSTCSVINGLTDFGHPCQALADLYTIRELVGRLEGRTLAWVGDANNVARSLALGCGKLGMRMIMATPEKHQFDRAVAGLAPRAGARAGPCGDDRPGGGGLRRGGHLHGRLGEHGAGERSARSAARDFAAYQVNAALMAHAQRAPSSCTACPRRRGEEVTDDVLDGPQSVVVQQAANRMHVQKGILAWLLGVRK